MIEIVTVIVTAAFILAMVGGLLFWLVRRLLRFRALSRFAAANGMSISFVDPFDLLGLGFTHFMELSRIGRGDGSLTPGAGSFFRMALLGVRMFGRMAGSRVENVVLGPGRGSRSARPITSIGPSWRSGCSSPSHSRGAIRWPSLISAWRCRRSRSARSGSVIG